MSFAEEHILQLIGLTNTLDDLVIAPRTAKFLNKKLGAELEEYTEPPDVPDFTWFEKSLWYAVLGFVEYAVIALSYAAFYSFCCLVGCQTCVCAQQLAEKVYALMKCDFLCSIEFPPMEMALSIGLCGSRLLCVPWSPWM